MPCASKNVSIEQLETGEFERFEFLRYVVDGRCMAWKNILDMRRAIDLLVHSSGGAGRSDWLLRSFDGIDSHLAGRTLGTAAEGARRQLLPADLRGHPQSSPAALFPELHSGIHRYGDHPEIAALIAPRALHLNLGETDNGSPIEEARAGCGRIAEAYAQQDATEQFRYFIEPATGHVLSPEMWNRTRTFFARHLQHASDPGKPHTPGVFLEVWGFCGGREVVLGQDLADDVSFNVGQSVVPPLVLERQLFVVDAQAVQDRRLQVVHVYSVLDDVVRVVVGPAVRHPCPHTATRQPDRKAPWMVVVPIVVVRQCALSIDGAAELAGPDHERFVEHAALLQIGDQCGGRLIRFAAQNGDLLRQFTVLIPAAVIELDESHATLGQPPREQTVAGESSRLAYLGAVEIERPLGLVRQVGQLWDRRLHPECQLVLGNAGTDFRITDFLSGELVESSDAIEDLASQRAIDPGRIGEVQDRVTAAAGTPTP